ncbi:enoyl-CoA hydratase/isomerase family protein [Hydrogenophaga sp. OTU3427]|uniref:enoyl-CoA hydratase/isomerase family protein n=1 Tax=Hydrogenophaga sp. OTU3427 TaxID=3043856 RepID=UPI00313E8F26
MDLISTQDMDAGVRVVTLSRANKRNAFNSATVAGLRQALQDFEASRQRVLVLRADGDHFCAGADLTDPPSGFWTCLPSMGVELTKPVVCAVQGWAIGLGFTLAMMSDLIVCADDTRFSYPEARVGVFGGVAAGLVARIPQKVAMEFLMMGEPMSAQRAYDVGMVNRVVPRAELDTTALQMAQTLAQMAPRVLSAIKRWTAQTTPRAPAETFSVESALVGAMMGSTDFQEGMASFRERRAPRFTGA